jgi:arylsulfatase A-like enzyme
MKTALVTIFLVSMIGWTTATVDADAETASETRPNILWITIEDWSPDLSCYGTKGISTPHVDKLASEGIRYKTAFTTSPVCSTSRSAMMTGFHQNLIGANQHRTDEKQPLPEGIRPIPHLFADAGYHTSLMSWKIDVNFLPDDHAGLFMGKDWSERKEGQPFFARITFGGTHRECLRDPERPIDPANVEIPPYYPDTEFVRRDWANGLEQMQRVDREVGALLKRLEDEGLAENTLVIFIGDHGRCHIRGKQFLYDGGTQIPMILRWPGKIEPDQVNDDLVMSIDLCATILEAAGIEAPKPLHGNSLFSDDVKNRKYVFAARDKMDITHDAMRSIRSKDHKLILNLMPERPYCQYSRYKEQCYPVLAEMNVLNLQGKLTPAQAAFLAATKPEVELFDLNADPHEINNLADDPNYGEVKSTLLAELTKWREDVINDQGVSNTFRGMKSDGQSAFPESCPTPTVAQWVKENYDQLDFKTYGAPAWYPTRSLEEWQVAKKVWEPWVFRNPEDKMKRPQVPYTEMFPTEKKKKKAKPATSTESNSKHSSVAPSQAKWYAKYKKQPNAPKPKDMLLNSDAEPDLTNGFVPMFNGTDLSGWKPIGGSCKFTVKDGQVVGTCVPGSPSTYLCTDRDDYSDFVFTCDVNWEVDGNTGVMFRAKVREKDGQQIVFGPQAELEGITQQRYWNGGIYGQSCGGYFYPVWLKEHQQARDALVRELSHWNRLTIAANGNVVKTWVNGVPVAHWIDDGTYQRGFFGLQVHKGAKGTILFRNVKVKEL